MMMTRCIIKKIKLRLEKEVPSSLCGIALGCVGLANTIRYFIDDFLVRNDNAINISMIVSTPLYVLSSIYVIIMIIRIVPPLSLYSFKKFNSFLFVKELSNPKTASSYGAYSMALALLFQAIAIAGTTMIPTLDEENTSNKNQQQYNFGGTIIYWFGLIGVYAAAVLQFVVMILFFISCYKTTTYPEPIYFPATVNIAMTSWTGVSVGMPRSIIEVTYWIGVLLAVICLPWAMYRCLSFPRSVAPNATIAILQAPASFVTVVWFQIGGSQWIGGGINGSSDKIDDVIITILFVCSQIVFYITLYSTYKRRKYILLRRDDDDNDGNNNNSDRGCFLVATARSITRSFNASWASFTFPTISTIIAVFKYSQRFNDNNIILYYGVLLACALLPCVLCILLYFTYLVIFNPKQLLASSSHSTIVVDDSFDGNDDDNREQNTCCKSNNNNVVSSSISSSQRLSSSSLTVTVKEDDSNDEDNEEGLELTSLPTLK